MGSWTFTNEVPVSIILAGTESAMTLTGHHEELVSRFATFELPKRSYGSEYLTFLVGLEFRLPLSFPSNLASKEKSIYLLHRSGGRIGKLCRIVKEAATDALQNGEESISLECLKNSAEAQGKEPRLAAAGL